ncbi:probable carboxylesterase 15 [Andrographis paniculata]|uniref:probable carboxylesterase 15 n=1 Tax=Andrographis paniculata TaxID=175694 RepID=UPI0021E9AE1F|nr:probable carboxylesterase 15 [Andrographis paniculata]
MGSVPPRIVEDCLGIVQVFSDGSISRCHDNDINFPMKVQDDGSAVWKDCPYDKKNSLHLRLYRPATAAGPPAPPKLPVLYFFHGGGFCVGSRTWPNCHNFCLRLASVLQVMVVAPDYRLAPEHRLPAAVEDALTAVKWLQIQALLGSGADEWLRDGLVDFDRVIVIGDSSGGNLAHQLALEFGSGSPVLHPVRIRGYVLMAPFFGGTVRTKSEAGPPEDFLNLDILDRFWRLSLPEGETADHPLANPSSGGSGSLLLSSSRMLVVVGEREVMRDRIHNYYKTLELLKDKDKDKDNDKEYVEFPGQQHGFYLTSPFSPATQHLLRHLRRFLNAT